MKPEKFKVVDYIRIFIKSLSSNLDSFPKKEYELKERIKKNSYDMLELAYEANSTEFVELKVNLINKMLAKIKLVDYLLDLAVDMTLLQNKKYLKMSNRLSDIEKYSRGWLAQAKESMTYCKRKLKNENKIDNETKIITEENKNAKLRSNKEVDRIFESEKARNSLNQLSLWTE